MRGQLVYAVEKAFDARRDCMRMRVVPKRLRGSKMRGHADARREKGFRCAEGTTYERMPSCKRGPEAQATENEKSPGAQAVECH